MAAATVAVSAVLIAAPSSPVGTAPPLTPIGPSGSIAPAGARAPNVAQKRLLAEALGEASSGDDEAERRVVPTIDPEKPQHWHARRIQLDVKPLAVAFSGDGKSVYVSAHDASLREYELEGGKMVHMASLPAQGDRIRVLHNRYVAVICTNKATHIPVMDTANWDRDPAQLWVGADPADIVALPAVPSAGPIVVAASSGGKRLAAFDLSDSRRIADLRLPHATQQLYRVVSQGRPYIGALGVGRRGGRTTGAWIDLFDPAEKPFGATRRSISVGRDPRAGSVTRDGSTLFFVDHVSNLASRLRIDGSTQVKTAAVGQGPVAAFLMHGDRYGITLDAGGQSATVLKLSSMKRVDTLVLGGSPESGAMSPDGSTLFVSFGKSSLSAKRFGAAVISGDPPRVTATLDTGRGTSRVAVSNDGSRAVVANKRDQTLTIIER